MASVNKMYEICVKDIKEDLTMWLIFLKLYNGITIITPKESMTSSDIHFYSDSCKTGYAGVFAKDYICGSFPENWHNHSIELLELYPIFLLILIFAHKLKHKNIIFHCDNKSVVFIINKQSSK